MIFYNDNVDVDGQRAMAWGSTGRAGSGTAVAPVDALIVVYDDLTIETGRVKVSVTGSAGGHNGITNSEDPTRPEPIVDATSAGLPSESRPTTSAPLSGASVRYR